MVTNFVLLVELKIDTLSLEGVLVVFLIFFFNFLIFFK